MVTIARAPLRITLGGGGTDVPEYYRRYGGMCLAAAIDKYVYVTVHDTFVDELIVKYSQMERVADASEVRHPIVRAALHMLDIDGQGLEICSHADIPAGTGLGSSSSFTVALLLALHAHQRDVVDQDELAREACEIELEMLKEPIGKQDQYIAARGGVRRLRFCKDDRVGVERLGISKATYDDLDDNLLMFFTGLRREASAMLRQVALSPERIDENLSMVYAVGELAAEDLEQGDVEGFAAQLDVQRQLKQDRLQRQPCDDWIEGVYATAREHGALGGKLVGAGGGGFLLLYADDRAQLRRAMGEIGLREVRFRFDFEGAKVMVA